MALALPSFSSDYILYGLVMLWTSARVNENHQFGHILSLARDSSSWTIFLGKPSHILEPHTGWLAVPLPWKGDLAFFWNITLHRVRSLVIIIFRPRVCLQILRSPPPSFFLSFSNSAWFLAGVIALRSVACVLLIMPSKQGRESESVAH